ncbi:unnamed protein product [Ixodes persulcatus]
MTLSGRRMTNWEARYPQFTPARNTCASLQEAKLPDGHRDVAVPWQRSRRQGGPVRWAVDREFRCSVCGMSFSQKMNLARHMQRHTGERPYPCHLCPKRFNQKCNLERHVRCHTGEKPFHCSFCPKSFNSKSNLNRHETSHLTRMQL